MDTLIDPKDGQGFHDARQSWTGRLLNDTRFEEAWSMTGILRDHIGQTGRFKQKLHAYAVAYAQGGSGDMYQGEETLREVFTHRYGRSMDKVRLEYDANEKALTPEQKKSLNNRVPEIEDIVSQGKFISFNRAVSHVAANAAQELKITELCAKNIIRDEFAQANHGANLYDHGKALDDQFFKPQLAQEKLERDQAKREKEAQRTSSVQPDNQQSQSNSGLDRPPTRQR